MGENLNTIKYKEISELHYECNPMHAIEVPDELRREEI